MAGSHSSHHPADARLVELCGLTGCRMPLLGGMATDAAESRGICMTNPGPAPGREALSTCRITTALDHGGNATGFTLFEYGMSGKWLELLKEISPVRETLPFTRPAGRKRRDSPHLQAGGHLRPHTLRKSRSERER